MAQCLIDSGAGLALSPTVDGCFALVLDPSEYASFMLFLSTPQPGDIGTAFAWGFSLVAGSYVIAWALGAVLNLLKEN